VIVKDPVCRIVNPADPATMMHVLPMKCYPVNVRNLSDLNGAVLANGIWWRQDAHRYFD
jgi:hypothetical protein